jgi:hypothetical protein
MEMLTLGIVVFLGYAVGKPIIRTAAMIRERRNALRKKVAADSPLHLRKTHTSTGRDQWDTTVPTWAVRMGHSNRGI